MRWTIIAALIAGAGVASVSTAAAQSATPAAAKPANPKLAGNWEGTFTSDGPSGGMTVQLTKATTWTVKAGLSGAEAPPGGEPRDLVINGDDVSWSQTFGEFDVAFKAKLSADGGQLAGTLEATQGGSYVGGGSFTLARKA